MHQPRATRVLRGSLAAAIATFLALVSHVTAGGQMPGWVGIVVPLVLSLAVCTALAGRRLSLWRLSVAVAVSQVLFHTLFVLGTFAPSSSTGGATHPHAHAAVSMPVGVAATTSTHLHAEGWMLVLHGVAAVVTVAALYRGERACHRLRSIAAELAQWVRRRLLPGSVALPVEPVRPGVPVARAPFRPSRSPLALSASRRGPPLLAVS